MSSTQSAVAFSPGTRLFTRAITQALPQALQVADRWHILKNLSQRVYRLVNRHYPSLVRKAKTTKLITTQCRPAPTSPSLRLRPEGTRSELAPARLSLAQRQAGYEQVIELAKQGKSQRQIVRDLAINRQTVGHYLAAGGPSSKGQHSKTTPSILAPYYVYLEQRWQAGCDNAAQLRQEIEAQGYKGRRQVVQLWVALRRKMVTSTAATNLQTSEARLPSLTKLSWLLSRQESELNKSDQAVLGLIKEEIELEKSWVLSQRFRELLRQRDVSKFPEWLADCLNSEVSELVSFAQGLARDQAAIEAGITSRFSSGQTEGRVNKLKLIKRQLYGRGSFELLRRKVLLAG